jgi:hypothetical protein
MNQIKVWPHLVIVAVLCALIAGLGVAFYFKHEQTVQAQALPNAARIQRVDGEVAFNDTVDTSNANGQTNSPADTQWVAATPNQSFSVGDRIYTRENSHASLAFTGRNFARLNPNTELDVLDLSDSRTQLALRDGSATFDVGYLNSGDLFEVATPCGAVDFEEAGLYNVDFDADGNALVSVLNGSAQVAGPEGSGRISKSEMLTLACQSAGQGTLTRLDGHSAGRAVGDYYRYQYPNTYDGRYDDNYDAYLNDPYYYDPYRRDVSYQYASAYIPGLNDLDYYGDWQDVSGYGHCWRPRVDASWAPYQQGYWANNYPYGPTWVSSETWGYAPYHYGRWVSAEHQWFWVPDAVNTTPRYAPALVAFFPLTDANEIGWVPLGPGDPYVPRYYDRNWRPYYLTRADVNPRRVVNLDVPGAITVVAVDAFDRDIDRRIIHQVDRQRLAQLRPTLDPLTLTPLRNAVTHSAWGRGKIDLPPGIGRRLNDRPVFVGAALPTQPFRRDLARTMRVETVPEKFTGRELKLERKGDESRGPDQTAAARAAEVARKNQIDQLAVEAARGNRDARQQVRVLEQQQRKQQIEQQQVQRQAVQQARQVQPIQPGPPLRQDRQLRQAQGERVGRHVQDQPQAESTHRLPRTLPQVERAQPRVERRVQAQPQPPVQQRPVNPQVHVPQQVERHEVRQAPPRVQEQAPMAPKHEARQGPPPQPPPQATAQPQGRAEGGGRGKGKKP